MYRNTLQMQQNSLAPFPDILASKEEKASDEYGLKYAKAIWGTYTTNIVTYNMQRQRDIINRQYAEGFESIEKFKKLKGIPNTSYLNLDFSPVNIIATTVDKIVGRLSEVGFKIQCNAIDPESKSKFDDARNSLYTDMFLKKYSDDIEKRTGIPLVPKGRQIPESDDEVELHMQMNYKEDASIAMEEAFNFVFSSNMFESSREQVLRDLIVLKRAAVQRYYDEDWNIRVERVDPVDVITPYSKYDDFRNIPYIALIKSYTVGELSMMKKFTNEQLWNIAKENAGKCNNPAWNFGDSFDGYYQSMDGGFSAPYLNFNVQVLEYYFLAIDKYVTEYKVSRRRKKFRKIKQNDPRDPEAESIEKDIQNLYQGKWIIGTEYVIKHQRAHNIPREKINGSYSPKASLPIKIIAPGIYDMKNKSHVERMIPHEDAINLANLAFQTMMIKAKPPGVAVDIRGLMDAAKGMGDNMKPIDVLKIYEQTGNLIFSSITEENDVINNRVITELRGGVSDAFRSLIEVWQFKKQQIYEVVGINPYMDPSASPKDVGLGVQDNAIQATNDSLRPLFNAHLKLIEQLAKETALMVQDCLEYDNEAFINAIGTQSTKVLEIGKKLAMVQQGIKIELLPDDREKADIVQFLQLGVQNQTLNASDAFKIKQVMKQDAKLASKLLVFLEDKNRKAAEAASAALQQQNGDIQIQSAQAAEQAKTEAAAQLLEMEKAKIEFEYQMKGALSAQEHKQTLAEISAKNQGVAQVAAINNEGKAVTQHVANTGKEAVEQLKHESKSAHIVMDSVLNAKDKETPKKK